MELDGSIKPSAHFRCTSNMTSDLHLLDHDIEVLDDDCKNIEYLNWMTRKPKVLLPSLHGGERFAIYSTMKSFRIRSPPHLPREKVCYSKDCAEELFADEVMCFVVLLTNASRMHKLKSCSTVGALR